jgi:membrane associated rhomboid family serine protease
MSRSAFVACVLVLVCTPGSRGGSAPTLLRRERADAPPRLALVVREPGRRRARHGVTILEPGDKPYRVQRHAPCTQGLLVVNVLMYGLQLLSAGRLTAAGCKPARAFRVSDWPRLFTPMFLHGSAVHIAVNSYTLNDVGSLVERSFGTPRFALIYTLAGLAGNAASFRYNMRVQSVGASGAIFGLVGAYMAFLLHNGAILGPRGARELENLGLMVAANFAMGMLHSGIDNCGHIGGLLGGGALGYWLGPQLMRGYSSNPLMMQSMVVDRSPWPRLARAVKRGRLTLKSVIRS